MNEWVVKNGEYLTNEERSYIQKIISYLVNDPTPMHNFTQRQLELDFVKFLQYYNKTSKQKYQAIYPAEFVEWIHTI